MTTKKPKKLRKTQTRKMRTRTRTTLGQMGQGKMQKTWEVGKGTDIEASSTGRV